MNLARRPFVNTRPVTRAAVLATLVGLLLLAANAFLYWSYFQGRGENREKLVELRAAMEREEARIEALESRLAGFDLELQNEQVSFLNRKIDERTFGWSLLFDRLADILPKDVRLLRLTPERREPERQRLPRRTARGREARPVPAEEAEEIRLSIAAQARDHEAILELIDAFFASPLFEAPNLAQERTEEDGLVTFTLDVVYLPEGAAPGTALSPATVRPATTGDGLEELGNQPGDGAGTPGGEAGSGAADAEIVEAGGRGEAS